MPSLPFLFSMRFAFLFVMSVLILHAADQSALRQRATTDIKDATIILCHEWPQHTIAELPAILAELKRQGAEFVTFSELVTGK